MTRNTLHLAEHFIARNARLLDRYRFMYHFQGGPAHIVSTVLDAYRNVDGGYGNALEPDLRGHGSQPLATMVALQILDELGPLSPDTTTGVCRYLTSVTRSDGGVPPVLPNIRYTEAAPWWHDRRDFSGALEPTAAIVGLLHKHHASSVWRDRATAFCWSRIATMNWTDPEEAIAVCAFLQHVPDRDRAHAEFARITPMIRAVIERDPTVHRHVHTPLDLAPTPGHIARALFTDHEINAHLDSLQETQGVDGGWPYRRSWAAGPTAEQRGRITIGRLLTLRAYGRVGDRLPQPRTRLNVNA